MTDIQLASQIHEHANIGKNITVAIYPNHQGAEVAIRDLQHAGFDMMRLSIVGKDYQTHEYVTGYYTAGDRMWSWGKLGAFWGGLWGILFGSAFFLIPGIGPVVMAGPLVAALVSCLEGAAVVGGVSALGAALVSLGAPTNSVIKYETELTAGKFVLIAHGTAEQTAQAKSLLQSSNHEGLIEHTA